MRTQKKAPPPSRPAARPPARRRGVDRPQITYIIPSELQIGDTLTGVYKQRLSDHNYAGVDRHLIQTKQGPVLFLGTWELDKKMRSVPVGDTVQIIFQGRRFFEGQDEGGWCYLFDVSNWRDGK